ncbi:MAG TPA: helix-hairpin-helix domain-containing protein [Bacteroidales bacterium]|nr:helix-hairpin-helix domain-containing protein [Bacteroidales bacterium]
MKWKDFFYFSRGERNGIVVLLVLILLALFAPTIYRALHRPPVYDHAAFETAVNDFEERLAAMRAAAEAERLLRRSTRGRTDAAENLRLTPFPFNPNELPVSEWERMGLPAHVVRTIKNFETAGGTFRFKEDLQRIFPLTDEMYAQLEPYINLPSRPITHAPPASLSRFSESGSGETLREALMININMADSAELVRLHGIGPSFSRRIINYRDRLGGFRYHYQLLEVFGMDSARLAGFRDNLVIDTLLIRKININVAEWADLVRHPYIDRNIANSLIAIRRQHGPFQSVHEIKRSHLITEELYLKLSPYLSVD